MSFKLQHFSVFVSCTLSPVDCTMYSVRVESKPQDSNSTNSKNTSVAGKVAVALTHRRNRRNGVSWCEVCRVPLHDCIHWRDLLPAAHWFTGQRFIKQHSSFSAGTGSRQCVWVCVKSHRDAQKKSDTQLCVLVCVPAYLPACVRTCTQVTSHRNLHLSLPSFFSSSGRKRWRFAGLICKAVRPYASCTWIIWTLRPDMYHVHVCMYHMVHVHHSVERGRCTFTYIALTTFFPMLTFIIKHTKKATVNCATVHLTQRLSPDKFGHPCARDGVELGP